MKFKICDFTVMEMFLQEGKAVLKVDSYIH